MPRFPWPPSAGQLRRVRPEHHTLRTGAVVARIYARGGAYPMQWNEFRGVGPLPTARFDHHVLGEHRAVMYGARDMITCVAEVFQGTRVADRLTDDRCFVLFGLTRSVRLLDLTGHWPTRAGASQAISSGPRTRAQAWARVIYDAYPKVEGLWYPSSMHGGHPAVLLFERADSAVPADAELDVPLSHAGLLPDLIRAAGALGYLLR